MSYITSVLETLFGDESEERIKELKEDMEKDHIRFTKEWDENHGGRNDEAYFTDRSQVGE